MASLIARSINVLIFSKTRGTRNPSIPAGIGAIKRLGAERGWTIDSTEEAQQFYTEGLQNYDVVIWLNTSGSILNPSQRLAYEEFHRSGKGTVAIHRGGVDTEQEGWPWYRKLASTAVLAESATKEVTLVNCAPSHPATFLWPHVHRHTAEWHKFAPDPSTNVQVLLYMYDALTYPDTGYPTAVAWCKEFDGGRYFYTALGGGSEEYASDPAFLSHLAGGIEWAAGRLPNHVVRATDGEALILKEFDGISPNGLWHKQAPSPEFGYSVTPWELRMDDSSSISHANRHLVRSGIGIDPKRPYAVEGRVTIPGPFDPNKYHSFCVNLNIEGPEGDYGNVNAWSVNIHPLTGGKSITRIMGFRNGGFFQTGQINNDWGKAFGVDTEYTFRVHVNADLNGLPQHKLVSMTLKSGDATLQEYQLDYSSFPYQPDYSRPVRLGFNSHGASWILRELRVYYLDIMQTA